MVLLERESGGADMAGGSAAAGVVVATLDARGGQRKQQAHGGRGEVTSRPEVDVRRRAWRGNRARRAR
jgi:hypothetical protein